MTRIPTPSRRLMSLLIAAPFIVAACTSTATDESTDEATATAPETAEAMAGEPAPGTEAPAAEAATWLDIELTNAETGEVFTLASLQGEIVAIEPIAVWCSNCKAQQDNAKQVYPEIEAAGVRYISLGIDPGENPGTLANYADKRGYEWTFVQSTTEFSRALSDLFGPQILSAPSTPLIVLDESGELFTQEFGFHGPEALLGILEQAGAQGAA